MINRPQSTDAGHQAVPNEHRKDPLASRVIDLIAATGLAIATSPIIVIALALAAIDTRSTGLFRQTRIGRHGRPFKICKIRTMRQGNGSESTVTTGNDARVTRLGRQWRRWKIDELPQLYNVLSGDMALVGPRPDVPGYADRLTGADRRVLSVRPGITGPAQLRFRDEERLLENQSDPQRYNDEVLYPLKTQINLAYVRQRSVWLDMRLVLATIGIGSIPGSCLPLEGVGARKGADAARQEEAER